MGQLTSFGEFLGSLDADAGKRGKQFEHFVKWFLKNDPEWSTQVDQVWLWDEYPNSWGRDCGIDLVFKHKNGENWAVQAKCYAPTTSITKADVDSFISESNRDGIDKRLLIATTDLIGANAKQVCDAQDKPVTRFLLSHFEDADIEYPATLNDLPKAKRKEKPKPRDHQIEAIEAVASNFKDVDRGQLIMACGTGKTFTTLWIKEKLGVESTLVLLPSLGLLSQTLHEWTLAANEEFQVLCVCSDESVGKKSSDEAVHSIADLAFPVTSSAGEIRSFLNGSGRKVVFSTYQSSPLIAEAQLDKNVPAFDLAIADEAHRCAGKVSGDFSTILDGEKIRAKKRLFTTATPRTYSSSVKKAAEDRGVEVVGMDDEAVFGKQLFALNFGEAIKRGLLTDYRVVIIGVDDPTISAWIENRELLKADSDIEMDAESLAAQVGLLKAIKDYDLHRLISFHSRVSRAEDFSQDIHKVLGWIDQKYKASGELKSDFVSGEMPTDKRRRKLAQLKGLKDNQRGLLTNARCLSEGVDVPSLDGVAFIDPRSSQIDIIQAVGRAIRLSANKQAGTIILPVFIGSTDNPEQALEHGNFKPIWDVLNALKAHDDVLADELNQIRTELGRKFGNKVDPEAFSKISIDLPVGIKKSFADGLRTMLVERTTDSWDYWYGLLIAWRLETGKFVPEINDVFRQKKIGVWAGSQRTNYKRGLLDKNRIKKIESLQGWSWDLVENLWLEGYSATTLYFSKYGSTRVPDKHITEEGFKLGSWLKTRRLDYKLGNLRQDKIAALEVFPDWSWNPSSDDWISIYNNIKDLLVTKTLHEIESGRNDKNLKKYTVWIFAQKRNYLAWASKPEESKITYPRLTKKEILLLEELPKWTWDRKKEVWNFNFSILKDYLSKNTFKTITAKTMHQNFAFGRWITKQRTAMKSNRLEPWKIKLLDSVNWVVDPFESQWNETYIILNEYVTETGSAIVPQSTLYKGKHLGAWVSSQRQDYKIKILSTDRVKKLEMLKGWVWEAGDTAAHSISKRGLSPSKLKNVKKT